MKTVAARPAAALPKVRVAAERAHVKTMRIHLKSLSPVVWTWNPSSFDRFFRVAVVAEVPSDGIQGRRSIGRTEEAVKLGFFLLTRSVAIGRAPRPIKKDHPEGLGWMRTVFESIDSCEVVESEIECSDSQILTSFILYTPPVKHTIIN